MTHTVVVRGRRLEVVGDRLVRDTVGADDLIFDLDREWDGLSVVAVLGDVEVSWRGEPLQVPPECLTEAGPLELSVVGYSGDGTVRLVTEEAPDALTVVRSGALVGEDPEVYTPSLLGQILGAADDATEAAREATDAAESATSASEAASAAAASAKQASEAAASAADDALSAAIAAGETVFDAWPDPDDPVGALVLKYPVFLETDDGTAVLIKVGDASE